MDKWPQLSVQNKTDRMPKNASCKRWDTLESLVLRNKELPMVFLSHCGQLPV